ncbi:hypothetical protein [Limimaricola cinnabarinus]|uniref:hypothetical protein n=1 Tax=Limimaricola cinnabarinus TaxID=1125964 RepID=UPI002492C7E3|nr:hypothetical protein [Limimaricola cinnabarinus]
MTFSGKRTSKTGRLAACGPPGKIIRPAERFCQTAQLRRRPVRFVADQKNPGAETGPAGPDRPGLPAVQQIACEKQEPRMKAEHHHAFYIRL